MPLASKIASAITLGVFALNITSGLAVPVTSGISQTGNVVRRDPDFTLTRSMTLVSRMDGSSSANLEEFRKKLLEAKSGEEKERLRAEFTSKNPEQKGAVNLLYVQICLEGVLHDMAESKTTLAKLEGLWPDGEGGPDEEGVPDEEKPEEMIKRLRGRLADVAKNAAGMLRSLEQVQGSSSSSG